MFDICPMIKRACPFCGISEGVYHCGIVKRKKKKKDLLETRIDKMKSCPENKEIKGNIISNTSAIITDKGVNICPKQDQLKLNQ